MPKRTPRAQDACAITQANGRGECLKKKVPTKAASRLIVAAYSPIPFGLLLAGGG
jgi:hypothetical protein